MEKKRCTLTVPPYLSGFVCTFHPAAQGSTPKHAIYTFIIYSQIWAMRCEKSRGRVCPIFFIKKTMYTKPV